MSLSGALDEKEFQIDIEKIRDKSYSFSFQDKDFEASLESMENGSIIIKIDEQPFRMFVSMNENGMGYLSLGSFIFNIRRNDMLNENEELLGSFDQLSGKGHGRIVSPMPGKVIKINVKKGDEVKKGNILMIIEAMKMENHISCPADGVIEKVNVKVGDMVNGSTRLVELEQKSSQPT